ncbi:MAG: hypothetical protein IPH81_03070 [Candidatus Microthrix sp.]|nr:hypothetical protein [Candidatus Microthrix sp.]
MSSDEFPVVIRDGSMEDLRRILALLKQSKSTIGFLPDTAVEERLRKGTLLVASIDSQIVGYLLFDLVDDTVAIRQLAVERQPETSVSQMR